MLDETIDPGRVFDRKVRLWEIAEGCQLMDSHEAFRVLIRP
ncbi:MULTISPECIES: hypothetical protein [unclassified Frigoribacterium]|nr:MULTISPECIES: hypothetical protein [unclassified Frigoribacterium]MDY0892462.1 hypothetical protein [Frigoribacterium sp. CFBP9030]